jgi:hypothetical protein
MAEGDGGGGLEEKHLKYLNRALICASSASYDSASLA